MGLKSQDGITTLLLILGPPIFVIGLLLVVTIVAGLLQLFG